MSSTGGGSKVLDRSLKPSELLRVLANIRKTTRAVFVDGPPGIGKSAIAKALATSLGIAFVDERLSQLDPTDLRGQPRGVPDEGFGPGVIWAIPKKLPRDLDGVIDRTTTLAASIIIDLSRENRKGSNGIHYCTKLDITAESLTEGAEAVIVEQSLDGLEVVLFALDNDGKRTSRKVPGAVRVRVKGKAQAIFALDEFNAGAQSVLAASYQLILDRMISEWLVPEGVWIIAMGNREGDGGIAFKMPSPIINRFCMLSAREDADEWLAHALSRMFSPVVVGYLSEYKPRLLVFEPKAIKRNFPSPRTWEMVSDYLIANPDTDDISLEHAVAGWIGEGFALEFCAHRALAGKLPKADDVLSGRITRMEDKNVEMQIAYTMVTKLSYKLKSMIDDIQKKHGANWEGTPDAADWYAKANTFIVFITANFKPEANVIACRSCINMYGLPFNIRAMPAFREFAKDYRKFIVAK